MDPDIMQGSSCRVDDHDHETRPTLLSFFLCQYRSNPSTCSELQQGQHDDNNEEIMSLGSTPRSVPSCCSRAWKQAIACFHHLDSLVCTCGHAGTWYSAEGMSAEASPPGVEPTLLTCHRGWPGDAGPLRETCRCPGPH